MIISNISVRKIDHNDPRYPDTAPFPLADVYLCECDTDEGPREASFFVRQPQNGAGLMPEVAGSMLELFSRAVRDMEKRAA